MIWEDILNAFEDLAATFFRHCRQDRGYAVRLRRHGKTNGIVDHHRWFVTVDVRELERLVINHHNHAIVRREKRFESDFRKCLHDAILSEAIIDLVRSVISSGQWNWAKLLRNSATKISGCSK